MFCTFCWQTLSARSTFICERRLRACFAACSSPGRTRPAAAAQARMHALLTSWLMCMKAGWWSRKHAVPVPPRRRRAIPSCSGARGDDPRWHRAAFGCYPLFSRGSCMHGRQDSKSSSGIRSLRLNASAAFLVTLKRASCKRNSARRARPSFT